MDFDHLITFLEIAKQGSFSRAGQKLYRSQPAVSAQIRQLEQEYGQKLFDRVGKSVRLTVAGEALLEYAAKLLTLRKRLHCWTTRSGSTRYRCGWYWGLR